MTHKRRVTLYFQVPVVYEYDWEESVDLDKMMELCRARAKTQLEQSFGDEVEFIEGIIARVSEGKT